MARRTRHLRKSKKSTRRTKKTRKTTHKKRHTKTRRHKKVRFSKSKNMPKLAKELQDAIRKAGGGQPTMMTGGGISIITHAFPIEAL